MVNRTFATDDKIYAQFKENCASERIDLGKKLTHLINQYNQSRLEFTTKEKNEHFILLEQDNNKELGFFDEPIKWIHKVSQYNSDEMKKFNTRRTFFEWLFLIYSEKIWEGLGHRTNLELVFDGTDENKALFQMGLKEEYEVLWNRYDHIKSKYPLSHA